MLEFEKRLALGSPHDSSDPPTATTASEAAPAGAAAPTPSDVLRLFTPEAAERFVGLLVDYARCFALKPACAFDLKVWKGARRGVRAHPGENGHSDTLVLLFGCPVHSLNRLPRVAPTLPAVA